jgi:hypothetical protein
MGVLTKRKRRIGKGIKKIKYQRIWGNFVAKPCG